MTRIAEAAPHDARAAAASCAVLVLLVGTAVFARLAPAGAHPALEATTPSTGPALAELPERLSETGLFDAGRPDAIDPRALAYAPQYPLWSDGATKRRWIRIPEGAVIDARDPDAWQFPAGTRFWKEFSFGRRVETRYIERLADGRFRYATYLWSEDERDARLVSAADGARVELQGAGAHELPRESDCRSCHEGRQTPVLGFGALQLSPDRDPNAPHREPTPPGGVDLRALAARGLLYGFPAALLREPPRIAAESPRERAALGYLFGNCSGCHNGQGPLASLGLDFDQRVGAAGRAGVLATAIGRPSRFLIPDAPESLRIAPGRAEASAVAFRMGSRFSAWQMPPLGTRAVDEQALQLVTDWITHDLTRVAQREGERR